MQHIPLFRYTPLVWHKSLAKQAVLLGFSKTHALRVVSGSVFKAESWGFFPATVIEPAVLAFPPIDITAVPKIVMVGNHFQERGRELGWTFVQGLLEQFPITIVGLNPGISGAVRLKNYGEFQTYLQRFSIYLYTIQMPYGDGFNLGLLEAMSMGMAVVTLYNPSSPIRHGESGLVAHTASDLAAHLTTLLQDDSMRMRLGEAAKKTVQQRFSLEEFREKWNRVFISVIQMSN
jgi:glycosyltransferase involved in cell wall biosynthesis